MIMENEEKAKAYDEAIRKAKITLGCCDSASIITEHTIYDIFPELKESEDERIRKGIKSILEHYKESGEVVCPYPFVSINDALAWLEKQGEQILANSAKTGKDEPKFHEGEWIISNDKKSTYQVIEVKRGIYVIRDNADDHEYHIGIEACERSGRLWTIQDAKPGDVLYSPTHHLIWIYKDKDKHYAGTNLNYLDIVVFDGDIVIPSDVQPATKEQHDLLSQKMKEAGYMWDAEKKEPKKIEQTPTWSKEDEEEFQIAIDTLVKAGQHDSANWLKSLKERYTWKPSDEQKVM